MTRASIQARLKALERQQAARRRAARSDLERRIEAQLEALPIEALASGDLAPALRSDLAELYSMLSPAEIGTAGSLRDAVLAAVVFGGVP